MRDKRWAALGLLLVGTAVLQELRKPAGERTWHGRLLGLVPYDFRPPTLERIRERLWNPADPRILTPQIFGVGWSINLYQVKEQLRAAIGAP